MGFFAYHYLKTQRNCYKNLNLNNVKDNKFFSCEAVKSAFLKKFFFS